MHVGGGNGQSTHLQLLRCFQEEGGTLLQLSDSPSKIRDSWELCSIKLWCPLLFVCTSIWYPLHSSIFPICLYTVFLVLFYNFMVLCFPWGPLKLGAVGLRWAAFFFSKVSLQDKAKFLVSYVPGSYHHAAVVCGEQKYGKSYYFFFFFNAAQCKPVYCFPHVKADTTTVPQFKNSLFLFF